MRIHEGKREAPIVVYAAHLPTGHIKEIELGFDQGLYLALTYDDGVANQPYHPNQAAGVDPGEIHTLTTFRKDGESLMVTGRKARSSDRCCSRIFRLIKPLIGGNPGTRRPLALPVFDY